jgi:hypothetical protein
MADRSTTANGEPVEQDSGHTRLTSSQTGSLYFAYGSNLSHTQMALRCNTSPGSSKPVAVARLDQYTWFICTRGYANVRSLPPDTPREPRSEVWGILYNLSPEDEQRLDLYEGHNENRNPYPQANPNPRTQSQKPYLQGAWDYNKHYLPVSVVKWLRDPSEYGIRASDWTIDSHYLANPSTVRVLVYVDELRTERGLINEEYIGRMNRGIRESEALGLDRQWVGKVMRRDIPPDIEVDQADYVGTAEGYIASNSASTFRINPADGAP